MENHVIEKIKEEGCTVSKQESAARKEWDMEIEQLAVVIIGMKTENQNLQLYH
jgi:hypothetical protein